MTAVFLLCCVGIAIAILAGFTPGHTAPPYIPPRDADFDTWIRNFSTLLTAAPTDYGLVAGDATAVAALVTAWGTAYAPVLSPTTKTPVTVAAKNLARKAAEFGVRPYAQLISRDASVSDDLKIGIGVNPRDNTPTPINPPSTPPDLFVDGAGPLSITFRYHDFGPRGVTKRRKPFGAKFLQLVGIVSPTPVTDANRMFPLASATRSPFTVEFAPEDGGGQGYFCARWITARGKPGPWSEIVSMTVPTSCNGS